MTTRSSPRDASKVALAASPQLNTPVPARLKLMCLVMLAVQTSAMILLTRYTRVGDRPMFLIFAMVICSEFCKLWLSSFLLVRELGSVARAVAAIKASLQGELLMESLKLLVPAGLYFFQNNVLIYAITNLDAVIYQILYQSKLLVTAVLSVLLLGRSLSMERWLALGGLFVGIVVVNLSSAKETSKAGGGQEQDATLGFVAVMCAAMSSGLAGVYFEKLVKGGKQSVWLRNIYLAFFSLIFGFITANTSGRQQMQEKGFFYGFDAVVWLVVAINSIGGMLVALVVKYADNILKGFATGISALISTVASVYMFGFMPNAKFAIGAVIVLGSTFVYGSAENLWPKR